MNKKRKKYELEKSKTSPIFSTYLDDCHILKTMPLIHKADLFTSCKIIEDGKVSVRECDVFTKEKIAYLFYGRGAYTIAQNESTRKDFTYFPVCFVFDPINIPLDKVFPFDSGAFSLEKYATFFHKNMDIHSFALKPDLSNIRGFVKYFYGGNENYYRSYPLNISSDISMSFEQEAYINMLNNRGSVEFDSRATAIEIITSSDIDLKVCLKAIILPIDQSRKFKKEVDDLEKNFHVEIIEYVTYGEGPASHNYEIRNHLYKYLEKEGYF